MVSAARAIGNSFRILFAAVIGAHERGRVRIFIAAADAERKTGGTEIILINIMSVFPDTCHYLSLIPRTFDTGVSRQLNLLRS